MTSLENKRYEFLCSSIFVVVPFPRDVMSFCIQQFKILRVTMYASGHEVEVDQL